MSPMLALGIAGAAIGGVSAIAKSRQQASQQKALQRQQDMAMQSDMMARQQQDAMLQQKQQQDEMTRQQAAKLTDSVKVDNPGALKGLGTIATSPLGDPTDPMLSKKKLLGN